MIKNDQKLPMIKTAQTAYTDQGVTASINANHYQMKIMPNEILRIQQRLKDLRAGNISQQEMFGPMISPKSRLSTKEEIPYRGL